MTFRSMLLHLFSVSEIFQPAAHRLYDFGSPSMVLSIEQSKSIKIDALIFCIISRSRRHISARSRTNIIRRSNVAPNRSSLKAYQRSVVDPYKRWNPKAYIIRRSNVASNRSSQKAYKRWNQSELQETHKSFKETLLGGQVYKYQDTPLTGNTNAFYPPGRHPC